MAERLKNLVLALMCFFGLFTARATADDICTSRCLFVQVFECADADCSINTAAPHAELSVDGKLYGTYEAGYRCIKYTGSAARYGSVRVQARSEGFESKDVSVQLTSGCSDTTPIFLAKQVKPASARATLETPRHNVKDRRDSAYPSPSIPASTSRPPRSDAVSAPRWGLDKPNKPVHETPGVSPLKVALYGLSAGSVAAGIAMIALRENAALRFNDSELCGTSKSDKGGGECLKHYNNAVNMGTGIIVSGIVAALSFSAAIAVPDRPYGLGIVRACMLNAAIGGVCTLHF